MQMRMGYGFKATLALCWQLLRLKRRAMILNRCVMINIGGIVGDGLVRTELLHVDTYCVAH